MATIVIVDKHKDNRPQGTKPNILHEEKLRWMWWPYAKPSGEGWQDDDRGLAVHKCRLNNLNLPDKDNLSLGKVADALFNPVRKAAEYYAYWQVAFGRDTVPDHLRQYIRPISNVQFLVDGIDIDVTSTTAYQYSHYYLAGVFCVDEGNFQGHKVKDTGSITLSHWNSEPCADEVKFPDGNVHLSPHTNQLWLWPGETIFHYNNRDKDKDKLWIQVLIS